MATNNIITPVTNNGRINNKATFQKLKPGKKVVVTKNESRGMRYFLQKHGDTCHGMITLKSIRGGDWVEVTCWTV